MEEPALLVTVGDATDRTAVVWVRARAAAPVTIEVGRDGDESVRTVVVEPSAARDFTVRAKLDGLVAATRYRYRIRAAGAEREGTFRTAPAPEDRFPFTLLWSADLGARGFCRRVGERYAVFDAMTARRPDVFLFLGDTIYADHRCGGGGAVPGAEFVARTLGEFQAKHRYNREDQAVQAFLGQTTVWATWDDHDVRGNFAGPTEEFMPVGRQAFLDYWPIDVPADDPTRLYRRFRYGRLAEVFILDTRQYRSRNCQPDGPDKTMLGARQRRWLIDALTTSAAVWKIVASSVPLSIPKAWPCGDSWARRGLALFSTGFAHERDVILDALLERAVSNVVFLAGDVHFASVIAHQPQPGFLLHELLAGPLSARPKQPDAPSHDLNPRVLFSAGGRPTFGEVEIGAMGLTVRVLDGAGGVLGTERIAPAPSSSYLGSAQSP
ncbi:MAG: alkaline phosphatase D family protein [Candidatus Rokubacteria bacterium]|nr:alkaline phosphatase D family protein [Candidatus Rokubacteria bacterium]